MSNELETQIKDSLFKDKILFFYERNKIKIKICCLLLVFVPIIFQVFFYLENKKNTKLISEYLKAEMLLSQNEIAAIKILDNLKTQGNDTIRFLSYSKLLEIYINKNNKEKARLELKNIKKNFDYKIFNNLINIKKILLNFENINEDEILDLTESQFKLNNLELISQKLIYDFYLKSNQQNKAKQFLNIK